MNHLKHNLGESDLMKNIYCIVLFLDSFFLFRSDDSNSPGRSNFFSIHASTFFWFLAGNNKLLALADINS